MTIYLLSRAIIPSEAETARTRPGVIALAVGGDVTYDVFVLVIDPANAAIGRFFSAPLPSARFASAVEGSQRVDGALCVGGV